ncbi:type IIL restriction-modification enzyme MmeI [Frigidibacter sp. SD6-1]|uniref:type IIL restriction-modification enzyme MmeI n=1 Tax=Frigidibacter sp. SD6-1 TaxID=3032581 RepID=UPI0024DF6837|nr:type IIL restriction-modification enzyme MmeI [Frigidibacter sp. SD6-1]
MNAVEIEQAVSELAEQPFDRAEFQFQFLAAFGNKYATLKRLRTGVSSKSDVGGVRQTDNIHIATCAHVLPQTIGRRDSTLPLTLSRWRPLANIIPGSGVAVGILGGKRTNRLACIRLSPDRLTLVSRREGSSMGDRNHLAKASSDPFVGHNLALGLGSRPHEIQTFLC